MKKKNFNEIISETEYIWKNNCLSRDRISKKTTYQSWGIPSKFKHHYQNEDKDKRFFKISFPQLEDAEAIYDFFVVNSGEEIQFPQSMQELCETLAQEAEENFTIIFQALDINKSSPTPKNPSDIRIVTERIIKQRTQQGKYRQNLINLWGGKCALTNIDFHYLLTASHIKRFSECKNNEAYDPSNGLLLSAHIDKLFDQGFITFDNQGKILVSKKLPSNLLEKIGLNTDAKILFENLIHKEKKPEILEYMQFHREQIFQK
ncbi:HNH endonuclease [Neisseria shayeganii]|uniref:HNH endonuclease n=1 Tax=Neisseria shayeganii TaxID=607712 RepID=A0A7D7NAT0_9NEIS|nr:HNH endonuclease [Neisseria shayeganii]QMT40035.1 HNH endonuclease [Neisseria shayeganii]